MDPAEFRKMLEQFNAEAKADIERRAWNMAIGRALAIVDGARIPERSKSWISNRIKELRRSDGQEGDRS